MQNQTRRKQLSRKRPMEKEPSAALAEPALYINRELSWLEFNQRVLEEGQDSRILSWSGSNFCVSSPPIWTNFSKCASPDSSSSA